MMATHTSRSLSRHTLSASDPQNVSGAARRRRLEIKLLSGDLNSVTARRRLNDPAGAVAAETRHNAVRDDRITALPIIAMIIT